MTPAFTDPQEVKDLIMKRLVECKDNNIPLTTTGLALALGFTSRQSLLNYEAKEGFMDTIKRAKLEIEHYNERKLYDKSTPTAGVIFNLTNNYGWQNKYINENRNANAEVSKEELNKINDVLEENDEKAR